MSIHYQDLLTAVARRVGLDPDTVAVSEFADLRQFISTRLKIAWERTDWSALTLVEKRYFRQRWLPTGSYAAGAEVYDGNTSLYFQAIQAASGASESPTDANGAQRVEFWSLLEPEYSADDWVEGATYAPGDRVYDSLTDAFYQCHTAHTSSAILFPSATGGDERWGVLTEFDRTIAFRQTGRTPFDHPINAWDRNPLRDGRAETIESQVTPVGLHVLESCAYVWLEFRKVAPILTGEVWDATAAYLGGEQVYYISDTAPGNFYTILAATAPGNDPEDSPTLFELVDLPEFFRTYLIHGATADYLRPDGDGQNAAIEDALAEAELQRQVLLDEQAKPHLNRTVVLVR